jgi:glycosyltransferase involved in cell wall biosynthesis
MTAPVLLDMTRAACRRLKGSTPSGIDRVSDAYAARFAGKALAVLQLRGRAVVLDRAASKKLFSMLDEPGSVFRRELLTVLARLPRYIASKQETQGALYLNVSHTDFDLAAHWRSVGKLGLKPVYLLHDLIPLTRPHVTTSHKAARHKGRVVQAVTNAAGIIVSSEVAAQDLRNFVACQDLPLPPLLIAPIAGANLPIPLRPAKSLKTSFISIGTIEKRKNHALLLRTWSLLIDRMGDAAPQLVLAGSWGLRSGSVRSALEKDVRLRSLVEVRSGLCDAEVGRLMTDARAVLLPTLAEGYGLPMVEALQMRVPVIATDLPSFREIGQGIPTLLDPADAEGWADTIADFCNNGTERQRQLTAMSNFHAPTWDAHFAGLDEWLANLSAFKPGERLDSAGKMDNDQAPATSKRQNREAQC